MQAPLVDILYQDNHLFIVNKPAGILTQPSGTEQESLEQRAKDWIKIAYQKPGNVFLEAVHRLDKPVSGIVVFGRTSKALSRLGAFIRDRKTKKTYYALVEGCPAEQEGILQDYLVHGEHIAHIARQDDPQAKRARLSYQVIKKNNQTTLLAIKPETGRYHQIRAQLAHMGCPIMGDYKYGSQMSFAEGIGLHHGHLEIQHPTTLEWLLLEAPLPKTFAASQ
jgi:23S rRNA pseudouridine1911/1915/1917 synthase